MRKINIVFIALIVLEILVIGYIYFDRYPLGNWRGICKSPCEFHPSLLQPFQPADFTMPESCISMCDYFLPSSFFVVTDLLILTVLAYIVYLVVNLKKGK